MLGSEQVYVMLLKPGAVYGRAGSEQAYVVLLKPGAVWCIVGSELVYVMLLKPGHVWCSWVVNKVCLLLVSAVNKST